MAPDDSSASRALRTAARGRDERTPLYVLLLVLICVGVGVGIVSLIALAAYYLAG
jgi:hypothetical protein